MLIPGLKFKLPQGASYVSARRMATFFPQGSNIYSTTGTRLIRFVLSDATNLLDMNTFRLAFQVNNLDTVTALQASGHPGQCFLFFSTRLGVRRRLPRRRHSAREQGGRHAESGQARRSTADRGDRALRSDRRGPEYREPSSGLHRRALGPLHPPRTPPGPSSLRSSAASIRRTIYCPADFH